MSEGSKDDKSFRHQAVLLEQVLELLSPEPGETVIDATVGGAGHSAAIAQLLGKRGRLLCLDQDPAALEAARLRLHGTEPKVELVHSNFRELGAAARANGFAPCDCLLADLGVSSHQIDSAPRGFSFSKDGPLDMRMDPSSELSAADLLRDLDAHALASIFRRLGEERHALRIAKAVKQHGDLHSTIELAELIDRVVPHKGRGRIHPATRVFQALRLAVNQELESLEALLAVLPGLLADGGRAVIISFHSLEDRLVKKAFSRLAQSCTCPPELPVCQCGGEADFELIRRRVVRPEGQEISSNPRARSARLRAIRKRVAGVTL